jgi:hypothetical protein
MWCWFKPVSANAIGVLNRSTGPNGPHRGALVTPGFPQLFNHVETLSWLTDSPESRSSIPFWISPNCHSLESTKAVIASAAKDFERFERLESGVSVIACVHLYTYSPQLIEGNVDFPFPSGRVVLTHPQTTGQKPPAFAPELLPTLPSKVHPPPSTAQPNRIESPAPMTTSASSPPRVHV